MQDQVVVLDDRSCITSREQLKEQDHHNDGDDDDEVDYVLFPGETLSPPKPLQQCDSVSIANNQSNVLEENGLMVMGLMNQMTAVLS